eukprot:c14128_g1_i1 orf=2-154(-)
MECVLVGIFGDITFCHVVQAYGMINLFKPLSFTYFCLHLSFLQPLSCIWLS